MKRIAVTLFALLFLYSSSLGQKVAVEGGVHGGASISAFQDLISDFYGVGYTAGGHLDVNIVKSFSARLSADYHAFPSDKDELKPALGALFGVEPSSITGLEGGTISVFAVTLNALGKVPTSNLVTPYALFGLGIHSINLSDITGSANGESGTVTADDLDFKEGTKFGLNFGFGTEFKLRGFKLFVQAGYTLVFTEDESNGTIPIILGISLGG